ncbi:MULTISPECIES: GNAT family N-acetyltransferase [unclassified Acinetobacter]|uniref:GNAT family N-acetyltransferase n=1 Tax=unclassified Acinetobacter TaxID=196816 RepID=UPI00244B02F0|nr:MULTISPECIES: GNAT family N-acetyltransferase [unclassified Acinetobacter]MDH0030378.1 GNAT family N-acetyltransferase [Acinetobacter sp. GD04021]MDH0885946.1 GNAT family N-acetyltransferase [Acinetobacter sp. GD03873]MDH1082566.1 GNAT family N-acetyltransferase [Acinetobacter sp. GD03983]MDH2189042.1 GNAT family N-acetyltransferase [Acinetobacter sp. GD03645]MDH2202230.1 GNAT family N-acetyltransferase [Acinetobacter sp. GD03647]
MMMLDSFKIERVLELPSQLDVLIAYSQSENFRFLNRLQQDFQTGENCFDRHGEALFAVYTMKDQLIAVAGLNQDSFHHSGQVGRLRRFYIHPDYRRQGVGAYLLQYIEQYAQTYFHELHLFTDTANAASFYQKMGYEPVDLPNSNFRKIF